ncbi:hypothetical protein [Thalassobius sp. MITS945101]|uniref:hypothetical protein n=1 Tax=Thalassobius sp. MITS945101 TaxID=3096994 RepID=UPI00399ACBB2
MIKAVLKPSEQCWVVWSKWDPIERSKFKALKHPKIVFTIGLTTLKCLYEETKEGHKYMKIQSVATLFAVALAVAGCAQSTVQQLSQSSFKVSTTAAPACGPQGARNVAFKTAAVEVIRKGGDLFIIEGDNANYDGWSGIHSQGMVVRIIKRGSSGASDALSARQVLGADWQSIVAEGVPDTCT